MIPHSRKIFWLALSGVVAIVLFGATVWPGPTSRSKILPLLEENRIYSVELLNNKVLQKRVIASDAKRILGFDESSQSVLYLTARGPESGDVWHVNMISGNQIRIFERAMDAQLAPKGNQIVVWTEGHRLYLLDNTGRLLKQIGVHGAAPLFSHDGRFVAYEKLADSSFDGAEQSLFEFSSGIAIYDLVTGKENLVTNSQGGEDFLPAGFSSDFKTLYFNSTRTGIASLWSVDIKSRDVQQLTNIGKNAPPFVPILSETAIWTSDRKLAISEIDGEIWLFSFDNNGAFLGASMLHPGQNVRWLNKDSTIIFRSENQWRILDLTQKLKKR